MSAPDSLPQSNLELAEWVCPICDCKGRVIIQPNDNLSPEKKPLSSLKMHIRTSKDSKHGGAYDYPDDLSIEELDNYCTVFEQGLSDGGISVPLQDPHPVGD